MTTSPASAAPALSVFDAHVDSLQRALDLGHDLGRRGPGQLDLERGRAGGLGAVVLVCWCEPAYVPPERGGARARTEALLDCLHALVERHPERVRFARDGGELERANRSGRVAAIAGIEGGHSIEDSLETLEHFFARGVRVMTLVWNVHLCWIRSCQDGAGPGVPEGLSGFGRAVVRRMNELGMLVDLSHAGERAFFDALEAGERPAIASHSACRALHDHPRNLSDDQMRALAASGGVCGIVFVPGFLGAGGRADGVVTSERVLDHVVHAVEVMGVEHVGLGSDFDGTPTPPRGLEDASCYPVLAEGLAARGFAQDEVLAVLGGNLRRVFAAATAKRPGPPAPVTS